MNQPKFITRKEIAAELEESVDLVRKNEKRWGIYQCRAGFCRPVKYWRVKCLAMLKQNGLIA